MLRRATVAAMFVLVFWVPVVSASMPVYGGRITQRFWSGHKAYDIMAPFGTLVRAAWNGVVVFAGWQRNCGGNQVYIRQTNGLYSAYYHMSAILAHAGERVSAGTPIGRIGMTGIPFPGVHMVCATGPHLHFEVWRTYPYRDGDTRIDPWWTLTHRPGAKPQAKPKPKPKVIVHIAIPAPILLVRPRFAQWPV